MFVALSVAALISSCHFPYQPEPFVLPDWPVSPYVFPNKDTIASFFNTTNVKIAYALNVENGHRTVYFIDFNTPTPAPVKLIKPAGMENIDADSPLISPDGTFVAYSLITGTIHGAYIQKLDATALPVLVASNGTEPHWWKDSAGQVYVIYSDEYLVNNIGTDVGHHTFRQKVSLSSNGSLQGTADTLAPYSMNGGLSKDGRYLCTGYKYAAFYDISTKTLISINGNNQVCNPSIDPDSSLLYRMMFLNFSGVQTLNNPFAFPVGGNLGQHEYLFIVDPGNTVQDYVPVTIMGNSYHAWQCPEWSNNPDFAAAIALADDAAPAGDGVIIKGISNHSAQKKILVFTQGSGKLNTQRATPYVWIGN